jgi:type IV pilus assembly protein PilW
MNTSHRFHARRQAGLTLIEFMIALVIGMLMIAAIATLIANQSTNRAEIDRAGKMIENGRYAMQALTTDAQLAGYWGEYYAAPGSGGTMDPCSLDPAEIQNDTLEHIQGYDDTAGAFPACALNRLTGTDVLVIRRADTDSSDVETGGNPDMAKLKQGQVYLQTGLDSTSQLRYVMAAAAAASATNGTTFNLTKKVTTNKATIRKMHVHTYYISKCSVPTGSGGLCTATDDGGAPIPTLKRVELTYSGTATALTTTTVAEGIENMQVDYGTDTDGDGMPDTYVSAASITTAAGWGNVMTARVYMLSRGSEKTPGFSDAGRTYTMGTYGAASAAAADQGYRRHVFTQTVRLVNPAGRLAP